MTDLIERLRNPPCDEQWTHGGLFDEAADRIEELEAALQEIAGYWRQEQCSQMAKVALAAVKDKP